MYRKGGRYGPTFHQAGGRGGRTIGTKRTLLVEILGLPVAAGACSATSACSLVMPSSPSGNRARVSRRPASLPV